MTDKYSKDELVIKNYMEDIVRRNIEEQKENKVAGCWCSHCEKDVYAYALNHLPPKYVVTDKGHIFTKIQEMEAQFNADVTREVYRAVEFVAKNKRHA